MSKKDVLDEYYSVMARINNIYKFTMILQGISAGWWLLVLGLFELFINKQYTEPLEHRNYKTDVLQRIQNEPYMRISKFVEFHKFLK